MKRMMILMMTCLMALATEAQVITSATVSNAYEKAAMACGGEFAYNAEYNADGDIVAMEVYRKRVRRGDVVSLRPVCRYQYVYAADGLLSSRVKQVWRSDKWQPSGKHDYQLSDALYTVEYSCWSSREGGYGQPLSMMTYSLQPDRTVASVACYRRHRGAAAMELEWLAVVDSQFAGLDYDLTKE